MNNQGELNVQKGNLLISQPLIEDDFFHNSVIFLTQHSNDSVVGFIINKPIEIKINDLIEDLGGEFDQVKQLINDGILSSKDIRFFIGYSGWGVDQLKSELENQSWIIDEIDNSLFEWDVVKLWENRLCKKENKYKLWVNAPKDISLN